ncbi:FAD-dependent pyridine nucleotide-disulphide oxidoreductase [Kribbella flavida DSM 17836]|uniref:FAD-dependent pyridine nucleotide-disulphide oxidoreductase n=1 Tax=Kribbella flavida (strain DSM 17836 / JCM 10339 / NBRC 14399) TaxID=479435 RepID=D2Q0K2_KRIFD|nr:NAD(P)/FAD-dependent oxidoreductase [Kribbella flavida]ADB33802.1 FAD-dependent pyridine nucleotide-disulphide oxidoreductase [Kribbella flavida DSM 17836]
MYDVIVVGGGAAGLSGALALVRARRSVLVVDRGDPRNAPADGVHNFLTRDGTPPAELTALGRAEVTGYGGEVITGTVTSARPTGDAEIGFEVELTDGRTFQARRLLVTTGVTDQLPDVPGLAERFGRDVLHCPYCHGWEVRDQAIGVLQTGPMAIHQVMLFRQLSDDVTLFLHEGPEPTEQQWEELAARGISVVQGEVEAVETTDDRLTGVRLRGGRVIARQALVVQTSLRARARFLDELGLKAGDREIRGVVIGTAVDAGPGGTTDVPGVWVAGNVTEPMAQVISAAAAGLAAGAGINAELVAEDTRRAVAARSS